MYHVCTVRVESATVRRNQYFGAGTGDMVLESSRCQGDEYEIMSCGILFHHYAHVEEKERDVGIICEGKFSVLYIHLSFS